MVERPEGFWKAMKDVHGRLGYPTRVYEVGKKGVGKIFATYYSGPIGYLTRLQFSVGKVGVVGTADFDLCWYYPEREKIGFTVMDDSWPPPGRILVEVEGVDLNNKPEGSVTFVADSCEGDCRA